jgi:hypothetical protein
MSLTPQQRRTRASAAAYAQWSKELDPTARTARARGAFLARFEAEVPASVTDPATRARMAEQARRSYFKKLALASSRARSKKGRADDVA